MLALAGDTEHQTDDPRQAAGGQQRHLEEARRVDIWPPDVGRTKSTRSSKGYAPSAGASTGLHPQYDPWRASSLAWRAGVGPPLWLRHR